MEWLNFHHLRYFWMVARKGGVRKAAEELHVSQPSISAQLRLLEESLGEKLFKRTGRRLVLSEMGELVLTYADEIFAAGRELMNAVKQRPSGRRLRLNDAEAADIELAGNAFDQHPVMNRARRPLDLKAGGEAADGRAAIGV